MKNQILIIILALLFGPFANSQVTIFWTGANHTTDWFDIGNWDTGGIPDSMDIVGISNVPDSMPQLTGTAIIQGLIMQPNTRFIIDTLSVLQINSPANAGLVARGLFINYGQLEIAASDYGIGPSSHMGEIRNYGKMFIHSQNQAAIEYHKILNAQSGGIHLSSELNDGMVITDELNNLGYIQVDSAQGSGLRTSGMLIKNGCAGILDIRNCQTGIEAHGNFNNNADIYLRQVNQGIVHRQISGMGTFQNGDDRIIYMHEVSDTAISSDHFENLGYIELYGGASTTGIQVDSGQIFNNAAGGQLNLFGEFESSLSVSLDGQFFTWQLNQGIKNDSLLTWQYNRNEYNRMIDSSVRNFLIHVPEIYDSTTAVPILFMFHGSSGTGTKFYNISGWKEKANVENFIAVFPTGLRYYIPEDNNCITKWSSDGLSEQTIPGIPIKDDLPFIRELISLCKNTFNIDTSRIYACGFSNGGAFVRTRLLDEMSSEFSATAAAGGFGLRYALDIPDSIFLPHFDLIGSIDDRALSSTGVSPEFPYAADSLLAISTVQEKIYNMAATLQVDTTYSEDSHLPAYHIIQFQDDLSGQGNEYNLCMVPGLGHAFANGTNHPVVYADILWPWFMLWVR
jgi:polyhydroxybutyrate depolymerase